MLKKDEFANSFGNDPQRFYDLSEKEQKIVMNWVKIYVKSIKSFSNIHSYGIKEAFEYSPNGFYIENGVIKEAMLKSGFKVKNLEEKNWVFNVSLKSPFIKFYPWNR